MAIKSTASIYQIIEEVMRKSETPLTCVDLYDLPQVKKHAESTNKVSDYLGHMWRRGLLQRWYNPANNTQKARYAYTWKEQNDTELKPVNVVPMHSVRGNAAYVKPNVTITEEEASVVLDFPEFTITIRRKGES